MPLEFSTITGVLPGAGMGLAGLWLFGFVAGCLTGGLVLTAPAALPVPVLVWAVATVVAPPPWGVAGASAAGLPESPPRVSTATTVMIAASNNPMAMRRVTRRTAWR